MEERSNSITHTNDENKDQSSDQIVRCDICTRSFRTNRGLLQHLNFCRRRNRQEGDNLNGNIPTNNINHNNFNEVVEISNATNSCQNNQNENQEYSYWNNVAGTQFANELNNTYEKIVHWKRNLFMLPSGAAGKNYIEEVTRLMKLWINDTLLREIALKAVHEMPVLLLQKPSKSLKSKDHHAALERRTNYTGKVEVIR